MISTNCYQRPGNCRIMCRH